MKTRLLKRWIAICGLLSLVALAAACGGSDSESGEGRPGGGRPGGGRGGPPGGFGGAPGGGATAVPVEVAEVALRDISSFIETNGTLEAEFEVDIVARTSGPIVELSVEEGMTVKKGQLLARIEDDQFRAQLAIARVELNESKLAYERAANLYKQELISVEEYEAIRGRYEGAQAQVKSSQIQLDFTSIRAPFDGLIIRRYIKFAQYLGVNDQLFRISDFNQLLCPIQVPEREIPNLAIGQSANLMVEAWPGHRFDAEVLRISPVVDASTGTVRVTLQVDTEGRLRPGMFASVFLEKARRLGVPVIPRAALTLDSIGDTVYVADGDTAARRDVRLGFYEGDMVEVLEGVQPGERVVVVGQDGLSDGTPIQVLSGTAEGSPPPTGGPPSAASAMAAGGGRPAGGPPEGAQPAAGGPGGRRGPPDIARMTPEQLEQIKERMRSRGMTDAQIEERLKQWRERSQPNGQD